MSRKLYYVLALGGLCLLFAKFYFDLTAAVTQPLSPNLAADMGNHILPYYNYIRESVLSGTAPAWNPWTETGSPVTGQLGVSLYYPLTWLIFALDIPHALLAIQFITVLIGLLGMYRYTSYLGLSQPGRLLSTVLFAFAVFTESTSPTLGSTYCWFPWLLLLFHQHFARPSFASAMSLCAVVALCVLAGFPNFFVYTALIVGVYGLVTLLIDRSAEPLYKNLPQKIALLAPALALAAGTTAVQLLPFFELSNLSDRAIDGVATYNPDSFWETFSLRLMLDNFLLPNASYLHANHLLEVNAGVAYLGAVVLLLPFALLSKQHRTPVVAIASAGLFFVIFLLSYKLPELSFLQRLPMVSELRINGRGVAYVEALLIILSGIGLSELTARTGNRSRTWPGKLLLAACCAAAITWAVQANQADLPALSIALVAALILLASCTMNPSLRPKLVWLLLLVLVLDVGTHRSNRFLVPLFTPQISNQTLLTGLAHADTLPPYSRGIVSSENMFDTALFVNMGLTHQRPLVSAYNGLALARWKNFLRHFIGEERFDNIVANTAAQRFYGILSVPLLRALEQDDRILGAASIEYIYSADGPRVNSAALPRAYVVHNAKLASNEQESLQLLERHLDEIRHTVIMEGLEEPPVIAASTGTGTSSADITSYRPNDIELRVQAAGTGIVVLTDSYFPGWEATVNGQSADIYRANSLFRAVVVPKGESLVRFSYRPQSLRNGLTISLLSIFLSSVLLALARARARRSALER